MARLRHGVLILLAAGAIAGCGVRGEGAAPGPQVTAAPPATTGPAATPTVAPPTAATPQPVPEALRFTAKTVDGGQFDAATLGGKPVVLWFWAAWCPKCRGDAPEVKTLQQQFAGKVHVVGVAGLGSGANGMKDFIGDYGLTGFPNLADDEGTVWRKFGVTYQHYYIVIDKSGVVAHKGSMNIATLRDRVAALAG